MESVFLKIRITTSMNLDYMLDQRFCDLYGITKHTLVEAPTSRGTDSRGI